MPLNRSVDWQGTTYVEENVGESLIEAMIADNLASTEASDTGDSAHARDRVYMRRTFFGEVNLQQWIQSELAELGL